MCVIVTLIVYLYIRMQIYASTNTKQYYNARSGVATVYAIKWPIKLCHDISFAMIYVSVNVANANAKWK